MIVYVMCDLFYDRHHTHVYDFLRSSNTFYIFYCSCFIVPSGCVIIRPIKIPKTHRFPVLFLVSTVSSQQGGPGFKSTGRLGTVLVEFACSSPHGCVDFLRVLQPPPQSKAMDGVGDSKLAAGVNVSPLTCPGCILLLSLR